MVAKMLPEGETVIVSGKVEWFNGRASMVHPDYIASLEDAANLPMVEPVYPLTAGLSPKTLARAVKEALSRVPTMPEWVDAPLLARERFTSFQQSLNTLHLPEDPPILGLKVFRDAGSPMTSFSPDNWRSPLFAPRPDVFPVAHWKEQDASSPKSCATCPIA